MIKKLQALINEWEKEAKYLNNPWDDERDQCVGRTYLECAEQIKEVLASQPAVEADAENICAFCGTRKGLLYVCPCCGATENRTA